MSSLNSEQDNQNHPSAGRQDLSDEPEPAIAKEAAADKRGQTAGSGFGVSRAKVLVVGLVVALVTLAIMGLLFSVLSEGFTSFAQRAAQIFVPEGSDKPQQGADKDDDLNERIEQLGKKQEPNAPEIPRAPGL